MSFSNEVKNELARIEGQKSCCDKGELYGLLKMSGAIVLSGRKYRHSLLNRKCCFGAKDAATFED